MFICGWKGGILRSSDVVFPFFHMSLTVCDKSKLLYFVSLQEFLMKCRGHFSVNLSRQHFWTTVVFFFFPPPPTNRGTALTHTHTHTGARPPSSPICNLLVRSTGACPAVRKFPEAWNNSSGCKCHRTEVTTRGSPARLAPCPGWETSWDRRTQQDWRGASGKCSKSLLLEKITFCDRKTSSVFLQILFITGFSSTCQITRSEGNRLKISYRSDESWCNWKKQTLVIEICSFPSQMVPARRREGND